MKTNIVVLMFLFFIPSVALALPSFPGAEGSAAEATGGRGGTVYKVTKLTDDGSAGTFRDAVSSSNRIIVFNVSGWIQLTSSLYITASNLTIAGQTSPGGVGIYTSSSSPVKSPIILGNNIIITHLRFYNTQYEGINLGVWGGNGSPGAVGDNIMLDHLALWGGGDGAFETAFNAKKVTLSWSIIGPTSLANHPEGNHNYALLMWGHGDSPDTRLSLHRNYFVHNAQRNPAIQADTYASIHDTINNVTWNPQYYNNIMPAGPPKQNIIGNWSLGHPRNLNCGSTYTREIYYQFGSASNQLYVDDNWGPYRQPTDVPIKDPWESVGGEGGSVCNQLSTNYKASSRWTMPGIAVTATTMTATYAATVVAGTGPTKPQPDTFTTLLKSDWNNVGTLGSSAYYTVAELAAARTGTIAGMTGTLWTDSDGDGMDDAFEIAYLGGVSATPGADSDGDGYTNIEEWLFHAGGYQVGLGGNILPIVNITTPATNPITITANTLDIAGTSSDSDGTVTGCKYRIGSAPDAANGTAITGTTSWSGTVTTFSQGNNTLYVGCVDEDLGWGTDNTVVYLDSVAPTVSTLSPADGATGVNALANLVITFSEAMNRGTGNIVIKHTVGDTVFETIPVTDARVTGTGGTWPSTIVTINPTLPFVSGTGYYVQIASTAFVDTVSWPYAGIADTTTWNFSVADSIPPADSAWNPVKNATGVALNAPISMHLTDATGVSISTIAIGIEGAKHCCSGQACSGGTADLTCAGSAPDYTVTYTPSPNWNYQQQVDVTVNASDTVGNAMTQDSYHFTTVDPPPVTWTITSSVVGGNGMVNPSGAVVVNNGSSQTFIFGSDTGYRIADVLVNDVSVGVRPSYTFSNVTANATIKVSYSVVPVGTVIVDNSDAGSSFSGSWGTSTAYSGYYGTDYVHGLGEAGSWWQWATATLTNGSWSVYARWTSASARPPLVEYNITHAGTTETIAVNQTVNGGYWLLLGTYTFTTTGDAKVNDAVSADGACADAIMYVPMFVIPTPPLLIAATIQADGKTVTLNFGEPVQIGAHGDTPSHFILTPSAAPEAVITYVSGTSTSNLTYTVTSPRLISRVETVSLAYTQPGDGIEDIEGTDLATIAGPFTMTNNSQYMIPPTVTGITIVGGTVK